MTLNEYIKANENVMPIWINNNIDYIRENPKEALKKYYRQFAHGLKDYKKTDVKKEISGLYGRLYIKTVVFGGLSKIVEMNNNEFLGWICEAMEE